MRLSRGDKLEPYEIVEPIGKGGMGEVYRATDTRLGRPVAIKVSAREFSDRFEREARAISALNHPNVCTLYDVGPNYLVRSSSRAIRSRRSSSVAPSLSIKPCSMPSRSWTHWRRLTPKASSTAI